MTKEISSSFDDIKALAAEASDDAVIFEDGVLGAGICLVSEYYQQGFIPDDFESTLNPELVKRAKEIANSARGIRTAALANVKPRFMEMLWPWFLTHAYYEKTGFMLIEAGVEKGRGAFETFDEVENSDANIVELRQKIALSEDFHETFEPFLDQITQYLHDALRYTIQIRPEWIYMASQMAQKDKIDIMCSLRRWIDPYLMDVINAYTTAIEPEEKELLQADWH